MSSPYARTVQRLRVPGSSVFALLFLWLAAPNARSLWLGLPLALAGLVWRSWAAGHLRKDQRLCDSGPYAWHRNPLYAGTFTAALGVVVAAAQWYLAVAFAVLFLAIYLPVVRNEEEHLRAIFPGYAEYCARVGAFVPRRPAGGERPGFSFAVWLRNQEYKAVGGMLLAYAWLLWRAGG